MQDNSAVLFSKCLKSKIQKVFLETPENIKNKRKRKMMNFDRISPGKNLPDEFNVIIEISMNSDPVKYEVDKDSGAIFVNRFILTAVRYPCNYGYIPQTLSDDGDPIDVLVYSPFPIHTGTVILCRSIGMLEMEDESGRDVKLLALPVKKLYPVYDHIKNYNDLPLDEVKRIEHFFERYKDLEIGKWVKINGWKGIESARNEVLTSVKKFQCMNIEKENKYALKNSD